LRWFGAGLDGFGGQRVPGESRECGGNPVTVVLLCLTQGHGGADGSVPMPQSAYKTLPKLQGLGRTSGLKLRSKSGSPRQIAKTQCVIVIVITNQDSTSSRLLPRVWVHDSNREVPTGNDIQTFHHNWA
jgi:hypothetical protein